MAIQTASGTARDKEDKSFVKSPTREHFTAQEVVVGNKQTNSVPVTTLGVVWDSLSVTFPQQNQDLFTYSFENNIVLTILVTYDSNAKKQIIALQKEVF